MARAASTLLAWLPNVLFSHLKRFEYDMEQVRKVDSTRAEEELLAW